MRVIAFENGHPSTVVQGLAPTPFGPALLAWTPQGLCALAFVDSDAEHRAALERLQATWLAPTPAATLPEDPRTAAVWAARVARAGRAALPRGRDDDGPEADEPLTLVLRGTAFQRRVWQALLTIPPGAVLAYGALARRLGAPGAARAVGGALAANPLGWIVPCHRVVRADGRLHHYRWGPARKQALLDAETLALTPAAAA